MMNLNINVLNVLKDVNYVYHIMIVKYVKLINRIKINNVIVIKDYTKIVINFVHNVMDKIE